MPSVEKAHWQLLKQKWDKTEEGQLFIKLFALLGLESNYDLHRSIAIVLKVLLIKSDIYNTDPLKMSREY